MSVGLVIVFALGTSSAIEGPHRSFDAVTDITVGLVALGGAYLVSRYGVRHAAEKPGRSAEKTKRPGWSERMVARGGGLAFLVGIVLNIVPGVFPFVALKDIAELDYGTGATVLLVIGFYLIMFTPAEVPLVAGLVAPERTAAAVDDFNAWLNRNGRRLVVTTLAVIGIYLIVRGLVAAAQ